MWRGTFNINNTGIIYYAVPLNQYQLYLKETGLLSIVYGLKMPDPWCDIQCRDGEKTPIA